MPQPAVTRICQTDFPLDVGPGPEPGCLAVITDIEGPSYRPLGAAMFVDMQGRRRGTLSSGCIEDDVVLHAQQVLRAGEGRRLRYGRGSPFLDLVLPCGGGLEITLIPIADHALLQDIARNLAARQPVSVTVTAQNRLSRDPAVQGLRLQLLPRIRAIILGKGPEPLALFEMARHAGIDAKFFHAGPDRRPGDPRIRPLTGLGWPNEAAIDRWTAIALFFHDHDREPPLLRHALTSPAFYIGCLGSARARAAREEALRHLGLAQAQIDRMVRPFGLVAHARAPNALAAGVLAQIFDHARAS